MAEVTVLLPAYDEGPRIRRVVRELVPAYDVLVVDDGSTDDTAAEARAAGAAVVERPTSEGYVPALKHGFREASGGILVTLDADGEHRPADVDRLVAPVRNDEYDLVLGSRTVVPRRTERLLNALVRRQVGVSDAYTGFRALRASVAADLDVGPVSTCGTLVLEAAATGARIGEVTVETRDVRKPRGVAWNHGAHALAVLGYLLRSERSR